MSALTAFDTGSRSRGARITGPALVAGAVLGASIVLHVRDPHQSGSYFFCPWLMLTGTYCPGCGSLRAVNDLTNGDLLSATSSNLLFVGTIPFLVAMWWRWLAERWRGVPRVVNNLLVSRLALAFAALALVFWVARNLPGLEWLAP